jgi:predicted transcriptional regulator
MTGHEIRQKRRALNITLETLAEKSGISYPALQRIETKGVKPHANNLAAIVAALDAASKESVPEVK